MTLTPFGSLELIPSGTLQTFETEMIPYPDHRRRTIRVWLPGDYDGVKRFPVIYLHDGPINLLEVPNIGSSLLNRI